MRLPRSIGAAWLRHPDARLQCRPLAKADLIGCDMGSIDIGPTYLGKGEMATAPAATRRDLRKALLGARSIDVPLVIGSAGSAGAAPHLEATLAIIRDIARAEGLHFRLGVLRADLSRDMLRAGVCAPVRERHRRHAGADRGSDHRGRTYRRSDGDRPVSSRAGRRTLTCSSPAGRAIPASSHACRRCWASTPGSPCTWRRSSSAPRCAACPAAAIGSRRRWMTRGSCWRA